MYDTNDTAKEKNINPLGTNPTKWSNTLKQFVGCLSVFDCSVGFAFKRLMSPV